MVREPLSIGDRLRGERLGELLRKARGAHSITDVALRAGISPETLRKIERGRIPTPAFFTVVAVADVLELSLDGLLTQMDLFDTAQTPGSATYARPPDEGPAAATG